MDGALVGEKIIICFSGYAFFMRIYVICLILFELFRDLGRSLPPTKNKILSIYIFLFSQKNMQQIRIHFDELARRIYGASITE